MNSGRRRTRTRAAWLVAGLTALSTIGASLPAAAQDAFPAHGQVTGANPGADAAGASTATPMTDLLTRMDALEAQVARLTAQNEEMANRQHQLETRLAPVAATTDAAPAPATNTPATAAPPAVTSLPAPIAAKPATTANLSAMTDGASDRPVAERPAGPSRPSAQRVAAVRAVIKPDTGDAGLDEYSYGFRLYTAKFYPEAAQQLKLYIDKYPKDAHISHARNLLGRAYLDDGKPREAAPWFLMNYKSDPQGPRAADSLLNLAEAMHQLGDNNRACIALNEFASTYAVEAKGRLRPDYTKTRGALTCS